ncbi:InlB B-repeat-containing protein, partial [Clostridium sp. DL1XJH146]
INSYAVTFDVDGGSAVASENVEYNTEATKPADPTKTGYSFGGWYTDSTLTTAFDFDSVLVTEDTTIYAKWNINSYAVTFDVDGGSAVASENVEYNTKVTKPAEPTKTGYSFASWYANNTWTALFDFDNVLVTKNTTVYAKWNVSSYAVTFDVDGGSSVASESVVYNGKVTKPAEPTKTGYSFASWYANSTLTTAFDFNSVLVTKNTTVYAKWNINSYAVTFDVDGGSAVASENVEYNTKVTKPADPTKTGYSFGGWYTDSTLTTAFDFDSVLVTEDTTVYAKWVSVVTPATTVKGQVVDKNGDSVGVIDALVTTEASGNKNVELKAEQVLLMKQADGSEEPFSDISKIGFAAEDNINVSISADGKIQVNDLAMGSESIVPVTYDLGNGNEIIIEYMYIKVDDIGNVTITSTLVDPYGIITDISTDEVIAGANVTLYYADTARNKAAGKIADTLVELPIIDGFNPNNNKNPQVSDILGSYAFMVFPTSDYYIVVTKDKYEKYVSPTINVEKEIVKYDIEMTPIKEGTLVKTGSFIDVFMLNIIGSLLILAGLFFIKKKNIKFR